MASSEMLVLCNEIISWIRAFKRGAPINDETMGLDLIHEIGFSDDFLTSEHTLEHYSYQWRSELFDRDTYHGWKDKGCVDVKEKVSKKIEKMLAEHKCRSLPAHVKEQLQAIKENAKVPPKV